MWTIHFANILWKKCFRVAPKKRRGFRVASKQKGGLVARKKKPLPFKSWLPQMNNPDLNCGGRCENIFRNSFGHCLWMHNDIGSSWRISAWGLYFFLAFPLDECGLKVGTVYACFREDRTQNRYFLVRRARLLREATPGTGDKFLIPMLAPTFSVTSIRWKYQRNAISAGPYFSGSERIFLCKNYFVKLVSSFRLGST